MKRSSPSACTSRPPGPEAIPGTVRATQDYEADTRRLPASSAARLRRREHIVQLLDIQKLGAPEQRVLELSFRPWLKEKGVRNVVVSAVLALAGLLTFSFYGVGVVAIASMAVLVVLISAIEKISYSKEILVYKSLVRELTHRIEHLEGTPLTPMGGHPAEKAQQAVADPQAHTPGTVSTPM
jgi:hypothetical protein